ncbi:hypothetical protein ABIC60_003743 [Phyllobacterium ifriqiyense]
MYWFEWILYPIVVSAVFVSAIVVAFEWRRPKKRRSEKQ